MIWEWCPYFQNVDTVWYSRDWQCCRKMFPWSIGSLKDNKQKTYSALLPLFTQHKGMLAHCKQGFEMAGLLINISDDHDEPLQFYSTIYNIAVVVWHEIDVHFFKKCENLKFHKIRAHFLMSNLYNFNMAWYAYKSIITQNNWLNL